MASSLAACLHSVGSEMPRVHDMVPLLDVDGVIEALTARLRGTGLSLIARIGVIVSFLFLGGACNAFCILDWVVMAWLLLLAVWLVLAM